MLAYCNNFLSKQEILHDKISKKNYLLIHKNGSSSLRELAKIMPTQYVIYDDQFLNDTTENEVTVFVRPPIERFISGLATQLDVYQFPENLILKIINDDQFLMFYDPHTTPQFWSLLSLGKKKLIKFNIQPMSALNTVDKKVKHLNKKISTHRIDLSNKTIERLMHFYTEDIVMYNQFLNSSARLNDIIDKIKLEKSFLDDVLQYKQVLTYLF